MKFIIDRFEENFAIVEIENQGMVSIPRILIPKEAKEGDVLEIRIDLEETQERKKRIEDLMEDLWD